MARQRKATGGLWHWTHWTRLTGRLARGLLVLLALSFWALPGVRADGLADEAELHFQLGADAYRQDDYTRALQHFLTSNRLVHNKNVVFNIARTFERLGRYADAHRYYVDALQGEADTKVAAELEAALRRIGPNVAVLEVDTDPPGATIYLDRKDLGSRGTSPRPLAVPAGRYRIIAELDGHELAESSPVEAKVGQVTRVPLKLARIVGTLRIALKGAPEAEVHVGDEAAPVACVAPCDLELAPGGHLLFFTAKGFQSTPRQVQIKANTVSEITARLTTLSGSVVVEADETGAVIEIDGKPMGFTPTVVQSVPVGKRKVRILLRGYRTVEQEVEVRSGEQARLTDVRLVPIREVQAVSRVTEDIDLAASSLSIIDGRELRAFGYPTVASALRGVRGVYVSNDRTYESAGIRGIGEPNDYGNRVLVLQDGLNMNDDLLNSSYIGSDARSDLHDVDRIEVVRGPGSLLYGTGAFSGVVNLVPRARDYPTQAFAGISTYDNSVARGRGGAHVNFSDDAGMWASVSGARSEGFELPVRLINPAGGPPVQTAHAADRFRAVSTHGRGWWGPVNAQWMYHQRKQFIPVGALNTRFDDPRTYYQDERFAGEVRVEPSWDIIDVSARAHANHYHFAGAYIGIQPDPALIEDYYGTWFGIEARARIKPIDELWITVGGEGQFHPVVKMEGSEASDDFQPTADGDYLNEDRPFNFGAAYALVEVKPVDWFRANAGARIDVYSTFGPIVVPRGALIFRPVDGGVLKVMGGRAFRAPSVYEQHYNDGGFSQVSGVDPDRGLELKPESIVSGEIEYLQRFLEDWVAVAAANSSYVDNIITTVADESGPDVIRYANSDVPLFTLGGEVELRREWRRGWMVAAFYGYQRAQFLNADDPALQDNPRVINAPEHLAGARGVVPILNDLAAVAVRGTLEAPRRIGYDGDAETNAAFIVDTTLSGYATRYGLHYVVGIYNLFDWSFDLPVADTFASRTIRQNGRTFMLDVSIAYP